MHGRAISGFLAYGLPGVLLGLGLAWWLGGRGDQAAAQSAATGSTGRAAEPKKAQSPRPGPGGEVAGTLAFVTNGTGSGQFLYVIDTKKQAFAIYRVDPAAAKGTVKLEASRQYKWDLELEHYNNQAPEPAAIEATVKTLARTTH